MRLSLGSTQRILAALFVLITSAAALCAETSPTLNAQDIFLWPESVIAASKSPGKPVPSRGDGVVRIAEVERPSMRFYAAPTTTAPAAAVLVCPGGGYKHLAVDKEGTEVAEWLNTHGFSAFVLKYRIPQNRSAAFSDAQRAMGLIRKNSARWNIDPKRVGIIGFSAGGHLAARVSTDYQTRSYAAVDSADGMTCRPDFTILVYPAYLAGEEYRLAADIAVTSDTPRAFVVQTQDDKKHIPSSFAYVTALHKAGVPCEFHLFPAGGHGYGLRPKKEGIAEWPRLCGTWLRTMEE